jgi:predicted ATP-grasp superfamily ATP-dependent carboligase
MIDGVGEGVFGLACARGVEVLSAHRRIRMMNPRGSGSSACRSIPVAEELLRPVRDFIAGSELRGLFMIELLRDEQGRPWFMELNGRAWGSMALACRRGLDYPAWAVRAALDDTFTPREPADPPPMTARHLGREIVHLGAVMMRGDAPRLATTRDVITVRRGDAWYNWRRGQARVFAADTWATVRGQLRRGRSG